MNRDLRESIYYRQAAALVETAYQPGTGQISDAEDLQVAADGTRAVFTATVMRALDTEPIKRIAHVDLNTGATRVLTVGPRIDRHPRFSPDARLLAFLSDRRQPGDFQLLLLDLETLEVRTTPSVDGWVEYAQWSPDGLRIMLGVAGYGAQTSSSQGGMVSAREEGPDESWLPRVETGEESYLWRRIWLYELATQSVRQLTRDNLNVWHATWCGNQALAAVVSSHPGEGSWYRARVHLIDATDGHSHELYAPPDQLGELAGSPDGSRLAIVESIASDRGVVAGDLRLLDRSSGEVYRVDTRGVDVACVQWRSNDVLLLAGHRHFESVIGLYDTRSRMFSETWRSNEIGSAGAYIAVSGIDQQGDCALIGESFFRAPEIAVIREGQYDTVRSFGSNAQSGMSERVLRAEWRAPDGLMIEGWVLQPQCAAPHPLVMAIHGGPVWHWRPVSLAHRRLALLLLLRRGYAIFLPNPRGSSGRGQDYARRVVGDMGGADAEDCLSGLDHLVTLGIADPSRLGVTGVSYGGYLTAWLITQDPRFAAAAPTSPVSNRVTAHLLSSIPEFTTLFLGEEDYHHAGGKHFQRSPIMYAHNVRTPTLGVCGALDRCTPPTEAMQFHRALRAQGVPSILVTYPREGHGVRGFPSVVDYAARLACWFEQWMGESPLVTAEARLGTWERRLSP